MTAWQGSSRKYRPNRFDRCLSQDAIVTTLKNAIRKKQLAQSYLFSGPKGTGKTTLARLLAKAINCDALLPEIEPCNQCTSCREIRAGESPNLLEIDGASNRGIDDIRQIKETVSYAAASGKQKIYLIDEVHMLTKEAFNALLKTLEEPPPHVKFLFATTEPHKVPATILSRSQHFRLRRIEPSLIAKKLRLIADEQKIEIEEGALFAIAKRADGALRDAESLFDQITAFYDQRITEALVLEHLGIPPRALFFDIDQAGAKEDYKALFRITSTLFSSGFEPLFFLESLTEHIRKLLLVKEGAPLLSEEENREYRPSASLYSTPQCLDLLDYLMEAEKALRFSPAPFLFLETVLLHLVRSFKKVPLEAIFKKLQALEETFSRGEGPKLEVKREEAKQEVPVMPVVAPHAPPKERWKIDTLLQFAAVELEGTLS